MCGEQPRQHGQADGADHQLAHHPQAVDAAGIGSAGGAGHAQDHQRAAGKGAGEAQAEQGGVVRNQGRGQVGGDEQQAGDEGCAAPVDAPQPPVGRQGGQAHGAQFAGKQVADLRRAQLPLRGELGGQRRGCHQHRGGDGGEQDDGGEQAEAVAGLGGGAADVGLGGHGRIPRQNTWTRRSRAWLPW
ncbi:hypothetical protein D9M71_536890 [compost metagenome]